MTNVLFLSSLYDILFIFQGRLEYHKDVKNGGSIMAVKNLVHGNECGLSLNAVEWLVIHHRSKASEREQMIRDLQLEPDSLIVDAGCGPGLWIPLLAHAIGPDGRIVGVDIAAETLLTAQQRSKGLWYHRQVQYKQTTLEQLPIQLGTADMIFSANVSQYLPDPIRTFAAMGRYLAPGGRLVIKDIDFGLMRFHNMDGGLQTRVFQARKRWETLRVEQGFPFEDSWVGSKLAGYLRAAGYEDVQEKPYCIRRRSPLSLDFRFYLEGIAKWFVSEDAPLLDGEDLRRWLRCFLDQQENILDRATFVSEETEFIVTGVWKKPSSPAYKLGVW